MTKFILFIYILFQPFFLVIGQHISLNTNLKELSADSIIVGAQRTELYYPLLKEKNIAVVANHTSLMGNVHLVDSLFNVGIKIKKIFCPEHGFRGIAPAGEKIKNNIDPNTKIPIVSLYGSYYKPKPNDLKGIDVVIFDIQDVGVRFYTYISTMTYVMEACAENNIDFIVLDRPNPNGYYIDGPVLEKEYTSFVGLHPIPIVHGLTVAEYAQMVNGEGWLKNGVKCNLTCIPVENYNHSYLYSLPIPPSPNLPNMNAVYLYPSLGFFEGTVVSVGRGTDNPFQVIGHPNLKNTSFSFIPETRSAALEPLYKGVQCNGYNLTEFADIYVKNLRSLYLYWLIATYKELAEQTFFFNSYFNQLAGNSKLKGQIIKGESEEVIRASWQTDINNYKKIRKKYLLYPDFE